MLIIYLWIAVQIIAEMLPISSSGHITLFEKMQYVFSGTALADMYTAVPLKTLYYVMHGPTLVLLGVYFFFVSPKPLFSWSLQKLWHYTGMIAIADCSTVLCYALINYFSLTIPLPLGFLISIALLFSLKKAPHGSRETFTSRDAMILGLIQGVALLGPGISRLAATFVAGRWLRLSPLHAFEISWLIQGPLIVAAFAKSCIFMVNTHAWSHLLNLPLALVIVSASSIAWCVFLGMIQLVQRNKVDLFAWYLLVPLVLSCML